MDTGNFRDRSAPPSSYPGIPILSCPRPGPPPGAPFCPTQRRTVASHPKKAAASPPLYSRDLRRPGALQQLAEFLSSFLQKLHRKLQTPLALQRPGLRQRPPARRPQLLPRRPAFVLLPHPALQPGRNSRIPLRRWGAAGAGPFPGPSRLCPRVPASEGAPGAGRSKLSTTAACSPLPPPRPCVRSGPAAARSLWAAGGLPPSLGELGAGPRACAAGPRTPRGWGLGIGVFLSPELAVFPVRTPPPPGWKASSHLRGDSRWSPGHHRVLTRAALGPRRHLRAPLVKGAGRMPPESSISRVRCSTFSRFHLLFLFN